MRIVMMGTGTFAEPTFAAALAAFPGQVVGLVTQPDRDTGRPGGSTRQTGPGLVAIAREAGVPVIQPESVNTPDGLAAMQAFAPDLLLVAAYGQILKPAVIAAPRFGAINVHASLLPKYRGASPIAHAILNGETQTGVTIIRITPGLDAGDMLASEAVDILPNETTGELEARLAPTGARLAVDVLRQMMTGPVIGVTQIPAQVTKAPKLTKEMGRIDWTQPAERVVNHIRAMQPWPTAYTFFHRPGKEPMRLLIGRTGRAYPATGPCQPTPGSLSVSGTVKLGVVCGASPDLALLEIEELQPAGKRRMTVAEFLRGYPIQDGYRFGPER